MSESNYLLIETQNYCTNDNVKGMNIFDRKGETRISVVDSKEDAFKFMNRDFKKAVVLVTDAPVKPDIRNHVYISLEDLCMVLVLSGARNVKVTLDLANWEKKFFSKCYCNDIDNSTKVDCPCSKNILIAKGHLDCFKVDAFDDMNKVEKLDDLNQVKKYNVTVEFTGKILKKINIDETKSLWEQAYK